MSVSIEISTFNNKEILRKALECLASQTYPAEHIEVVISDDGSSDGLTEMVESIHPTLPYRLKILCHEHKGPANAHNCGIEAADSEIVIMLASDILAVPSLVEEHVRSHEEHPDENVMVSGRLMQSHELPDNTFQRSWNKHVNRLFAEEKDDLRHGRFFVSNLSFKKSFMQRHGMFLDWPPAAQEDLELGYRLRQHGMVLLHNTRAAGCHHHPVTLQSIARRAYTQGYNWHLFEEHVPETWVRARSGHISMADGSFLYLRTLSKHVLRQIIINDLTVPVLYVPIIKVAEKWRFLEPAVPFLASKVSVYYFYKGRQDYERTNPWDPAHINV